MSNSNTQESGGADSNLFNSPASFYQDNRLRKKASRMIGRKLRPRLVTSDLMQETLLVSLRNISDLLGKPKRHVYRWMIEVMRRRVLEHARSARTESAKRELLAVAPQAPADDNLDRLINSEIAQLVRTYVDGTGEANRQIFYMRYVNGKSVKEIAGLLNKSEAAVHSSLYRTLQQVRLHLEQAI